MYQLNDGEVLAKTQRFLLCRKNNQFTIEVAELIFGKPSHGYKFQAYLLPISNGMVPKEFYGFGETYEKALEECLERLKNIDDETIMNWIIRPLSKEQIEEIEK